MHSRTRHDPGRRNIGEDYYTDKGALVKTV
jgi:hypothetical protein